MLALYAFLIALTGTFIQFFLKKKRQKWGVLLELFLQWAIPLNIGVLGIINFIAHAFFGPQVAAEIGWAAYSPFQFEVAVANLSFGIVGLLSLWLRGGFWLAVVIANSFFLLGDAIGHIRQQMRGDFAFYNSGALLWIGDVAIPLLLLLTVWVYAKQHKNALLR